jgi:hypothetical protein
MSLFDPELMKNCVKKSMRFLHELTRIEGQLCENCVTKLMRFLHELTRIEGTLCENCVTKLMTFLHELTRSAIGRASPRDDKKKIVFQRRRAFRSRFVDLRLVVHHRGVIRKRLFLRIVMSFCHYSSASEWSSVAAS